jgi:catechol 2,3-dioxygenase-like lactoylglutathione lyase family enzyme
MNITGIKLVTVPVTDQEKARDFYVDVLGLEVVQDMTMGPMRWLEVTPGKESTAHLALLPGMPGLSPGGLRGVQLFTSDLDGDCESLRAAGVEVDGPNARPWGRDATFADPDGNGFVLMASASG